MTAMLGTRLMSGALGAMMVAVGGLYLGPSELVRRPLPPDQLSIVTFIESLGPWWPVMFASTGVWILIGAARAKGLVTAHSVACGVWTLYSAAILIGAFLSEPPTPVLMGTVSGFLALINAEQSYVAEERGLR